MKNSSQNIDRRYDNIITISEEEHDYSDRELDMLSIEAMCAIEEDDKNLNN